MRKLIGAGILFFIVCMGCGRSPSTKSYVTYVATKGVDTAKALLNVNDYYFDGSLEIQYHGGFKDSGTVNGVLRGDTLIGDYSFLHYGLKWIRKPVALLKRKDTLIWGNGTVVNTFGRIHFDTKEPVIFADSNFVFIPLK